MELEKLLVNDNITASCQTNTLRFPSIVSKVTNNKKKLFTKAGKLFAKTTIAMRFNLLQVCPSAPLFVFVVLFIPSFNEQGNNG